MIGYRVTGVRRVLYEDPVVLQGPPLHSGTTQGWYTMDRNLGVEGCHGSYRTTVTTVPRVVGDDWSYPCTGSLFGFGLPSGSINPEVSVY